MPAFGVVDALQNSTVEMAQTAPYYFTGKDSIFAFGCAVPFGLTARQMDAWMEHRQRPQADGRVLRQLQHQEHAALATPAPKWVAGTAKKSRSVADLKGLKMRLGGGLFGEAMHKLGVVPQNMPAGDVYQALEKGTLDAAEFVGPYDDQKLGFNKGGPVSTTTPAGGKVAQSWSSLSTPRLTPLCPRSTRPWSMPPTSVAARDMTAKYDALQPHCPEEAWWPTAPSCKAFPKEFMDAGYKASMEVFAEHEAKSPEFKKIHAGHARLPA